MKYKVFIDGAEGTTGLKIHEYFSRRDDIELLKIDSSRRKDLEERLSFIKKADISFLCLPDSASRGNSCGSACGMQDTRYIDCAQDRQRMGIRHAGTLQRTEGKDKGKQQSGRSRMSCDRSHNAHKTSD